MPPDVAKYLFDVQKACKLLHEFTQGKSLDDYLADSLLRSAVERQFTIVGEALMQAEKLDAKQLTSISALRQIVGFRNILVHGYATIKHETVWDIVQNDLRLLEQQVGKILAGIGSP